MREDVTVLFPGRVHNCIDERSIIFRSKVQIVFRNCLILSLKFTVLKPIF